MLPTPEGAATSALGAGPRVAGSVNSRPPDPVPRVDRLPDPDLARCACETRMICIHMMVSVVAKDNSLIVLNDALKAGIFCLSGGRTCFPIASCGRV